MVSKTKRRFGLGVLLFCWVAAAIFAVRIASQPRSNRTEPRHSVERGDTTHASNDDTAAETAREQLWIIKGQDAVRAKLKDPDSAQFRGAFFHRSADGVPMSCGQVNAKNSLGGYNGFQRYVSADSEALTFLESEVDDFDTVWNRLCVGAQQQVLVATEEVPKDHQTDPTSTIRIPSDSHATYAVLTKRGTARRPTLTTRRDGPSGISYARRRFDCDAHTFMYLGEGDSLQEVESAPADKAMSQLVEGSISDYWWHYACGK